MTTEEKNKLDDIHAALCGNDYQSGLIARVEKLENQNFWHKVSISVASFVSISIGFLFKN